MKVTSFFALALALCAPTLAQTPRPSLAQRAAKNTIKPLTLQLEGVDCIACEVSVQESLERIKGVERVMVSAKEQRAVVWIRTNKVVTEKALSAAVVKAGYTVIKIQTGDIKPQRKSEIPS